MTLLIAENPHDTPTLLRLGFMTVAVPSCEDGLKQLVELVRRAEQAEVVIIRSPEGSNAQQLVSSLLCYKKLKVIAPPPKNATANDVKCLIAVTPAKTLKIRVSSSNKSASLCQIP